jgi:hypothetical protein
MLEAGLLANRMSVDQSLDSRIYSNLDSDPAISNIQIMCTNESTSYPDF